MTLRVVFRLETLLEYLFLEYLFLEYLFLEYLFLEYLFLEYLFLEYFLEVFLFLETLRPVLLAIYISIYILFLRNYR
jgi:hypothetical protein